MSSLEVSKINLSNLTLSSLQSSFHGLEWHTIDCAPWIDQFPYRPDVKFQIAHDEKNIIVRYSVQEEFVKATYIRPNENVWEDSCVEFFLSLDDRNTYYNFEFNVLGTGLIGYGPSVKTERNRLSADIINTVDSYVELSNRAGVKHWSIFLVIPKSIFGDVEFEGKTFHANFYKCGDALPNPHFIAWNNIDLPSPNFHQPQFFGEIKFL